MRPEKYRQGSRSAALARARMFMKADLFWLPGFPCGQEKGGVLWVTLPRKGERPPEQLRLQRNHLQRATHTRNKLVYHFPRVLPRLVEDRDRWVEGVPQLLKWLKGAIHRSEPLPASLLGANSGFSRTAVDRALRLVASHPALQPLVEALSWTTYLTPKELPEALDWLEANASAVQRLLQAERPIENLKNALMMWELTRRDGSRKMAPYLRVLSEPGAFTVVMDGAEAHVRCWTSALQLWLQDESRFAIPDLPDPTFGAELINLATWLVCQQDATRRRALELFALIYPENLLRQWQSWWSKVDPLLQQASSLTAARASTTVRQGVTDIRKRLTGLLELRPPFPHPGNVLANVRRASMPDKTDLYQALFSALQALPCDHGRKLVRAAFLDDWLDMDDQHSGVAVLLREFQTFLAAHGHLPGFLKAWWKIVAAWNKARPHRSWTFTDTLVDEVPDRRLWSVLFDAVAECCQAADFELNNDDGESMVKLVRLTSDARLASTLFLDLAKRDLREVFPSEKVLRCAFELDAVQGKFGELVDKLDTLELDHEDAGDALRQVARHFDQGGWPGLVRDLVLDGELRPLLEASRRLASGRALKLEVSPPERVSPTSIPGWCQHYPEQFAAALATLDAVASDADRIATRILGKHFPQPDRLRQEIAAIENRWREDPHDATLQRRLDNLRLRLTSTAEVSPVRAMRLLARLQRATRRALLHAWQHGLEAQLHSRLPQLLHVETVPEWLLAPRQLHVLACLLNLSRAFRELGLRLLRVRCGPPPWNLLDDPANQAFLSRLQTLGVDPEPWLEPPTPLVCQSKNGRTISLVFETDPLEIFQMGAHFQTCLSPGEFNFFSVFANAADINKHVIYARDERGQVVGRCLVAISTNGHLQTFHPYCHDKALGFDKMVATLVEDLAARMQTVVATVGWVPSLVAPDWYDDGPSDLGSRFEFLQRDSAFRLSLEELTPVAFIATLEKLFAPLALNALTLPLVIGLDELRQRPELVLPLLPRLEKGQVLPAETWLRVVELAHAAGAAWFVHQTVRTWALPFLKKQTRWGFWHCLELMTLVAELQPSAALRIMRRTREADVRSDEDEPDKERREILAIAHQALGRQALARRLRGET